MDSDFVNVFIKKQKAKIDDCVAQCVMLETQLEVQANSAERVRAELEQLRQATTDSEIELQAEFRVVEDGLREDIRRSDQVISGLFAEKDQLTADLEHFKRGYVDQQAATGALASENESLRHQVASLSAQTGALRDEIENMKASQESAFEALQAAHEAEVEALRSEIKVLKQRKRKED